MSKFKVVCKCGHVGRQYYVEIAFPIIASSKKEAASIARNFPRVKHHHKDAILSVELISDLEYEMLLIENQHDDYLHCNNIQEQNLLSMEERLIIDPHYQTNYFPVEEENKITMYKKKKVKNPKKFFKNFVMEQNYMEALSW